MSKTTRMFPLCEGTTQLAPTNAMCIRCGRYGQRCEATAKKQPVPPRLAGAEGE